MVDIGSKQQVSVEDLSLHERLSNNDCLSHIYLYLPLKSVPHR